MFSMQAQKVTTRHSSRGFSLIEVMIAMAIFAVGMLGVFSMQISSINGNATARRVTQDVTWAMDKTEQLLALAYTDTGDLKGVTSDVDANGQEHSIANGDFTVDNDGIDNDLDGEIDEGGEAAIVTITWFVLNESPDPDTKTIRITINHRVTLGRDREVNLEFIKANF
jgi:prepilin-type N-terminal cleavage/methylation domain-containing protein